LNTVAEILKNSKNRRRTFKKKKKITPIPIQEGSADVATELDINEILHNPKKRNQFMSYLKHVYAEENLAFWIAVQRYKELFEQDNCNMSALRKLAQKIVSEFVSSEAPQGVNIRSKTRASIVSLPQEEFTGNSFDKAEHEILLLLDGNFTSEFSQYLQTASETGTLVSSESDHARTSFSDTF